jgi:hypothetical protein
MQKMLENLIWPRKRELVEMNMKYKKRLLKLMKKRKARALIAATLKGKARILTISIRKFNLLQKGRRSCRITKPNSCRSKGDKQKVQGLKSAPASLEVTLESAQDNKKKNRKDSDLTVTLARKMMMEIISQVKVAV